MPIACHNVVSRSAGLLLTVVLGFGCAQAGGGVLPPGFGDTPDQFFFPTALALSDDEKSLYVVNSDFDRAYSSGSIVQVDLRAFEQEGTAADVSPFVLTRARVDRFGATLVKSPTGKALYLPTPDPDALTRIPLATGGGVACDDLDCSRNRVDLGAHGMSDPSAAVVASLRLPNSQVAEPAVLVLSLSQPAALNDEELKPARLAVIPERVASAQAKPFENGAYTLDIGAGASGLAFDEATGRAFITGCFERLGGGSIVDCAINSGSAFYGKNPLRSLVPELGAEAPIASTSLGGPTGGGASTAIALSSDGLRLFSLTARPDALSVFRLPELGASAVELESLVLLPNVPRALAVLPRTDGDWVAITSLESDALLIADPATGRVLKQVRPVGASPYGMAVQTLADKWRLYVSLFEACGVAAVDVPFTDPSLASVVATVGQCP